MQIDRSNLLKIDLLAFEQCAKERIKLNDEVVKETLVILKKWQNPPVNSENIFKPRGCNQQKACVIQVVVEQMIKDSKISKEIAENIFRI